MELGCHDRSCPFRENKGMCTNGGCRCLCDVPWEVRRDVTKRIAALRVRAERAESNGASLAIRLRAVESDRDATRERAERAEAERDGLRDELSARLDQQRLPLSDRIRETILQALAFSYAGNITPIDERKPLTMLQRSAVEKWIENWTQPEPDDAMAERDEAQRLIVEYTRFLNPDGVGGCDPKDDCETCALLDYGRALVAKRDAQ